MTPEKFAAALAEHEERDETLRTGLRPEPSPTPPTASPRSASPPIREAASTPATAPPRSVPAPDVVRQDLQATERLPSPSDEGETILMSREHLRETFLRELAEDEDEDDLETQQTALHIRRALRDD